MTTTTRPHRPRITRTYPTPIQPHQATTEDPGTDTQPTALPVLAFYGLLIVIVALITNLTLPAHRPAATITLIALTTAPAIYLTTRRLPDDGIAAYLTPIYLATILLTPTLFTGTPLLANQHPLTVTAIEALAIAATAIAPATLFLRALRHPHTSTTEITLRAIAVLIAIGAAHASLAWPLA